MDIEGKINNIIDKAQDKADWIAGLLSAWERFDGNIDQIISYYMKLNPKDPSGVGYQVMETLKDPSLLTYKLFRAPHMYSTAVKIGLGAYLAADFGLIAAKWKKTGEKIAWGAGIAAVTLPGSGGFDDSGNFSGSSSSSVRGI